MDFPSSKQRKTLKVLILGDAGVGKTSLLNRFAHHKFVPQYKATIGADFVSKEVVVQDNFGQQHVVNLQVWDTAGQERFQSLGHAYYRGTDAVMLVYDTTQTHTLERLQYWRRDFMDHAQLNLMVGSNNGRLSEFPFVVVANKVDKKEARKIPLLRGMEWSNQYHLTHFEASAKTSLNVEEAFQELARLALHHHRERPQLFVPPTTMPIDLRQQSSIASSSSQNPCC